jgi:hypothetical protein
MIRLEAIARPAKGRHHQEEGRSRQRRARRGATRYIVPGRWNLHPKRVVHD